MSNTCIGRACAEKACDTTLDDENITSLSVVSHAFSAHACPIDVFDIWASSSPLGYLCAKFRH